MTIIVRSCELLHTCRYPSNGPLSLSRSHKIHRRDWMIIQCQLFNICYDRSWTTLPVFIHRINGKWFDSITHQGVFGIKLNYEVNLSTGNLIGVLWLLITWVILHSDEPLNVNRTLNVHQNTWYHELNRLEDHNLMVTFIDSFNCERFNRDNIKVHWCFNRESLKSSIGNVRAPTAWRSVKCQWRP